jgi:hypothetical protein
MSSKAKLEQAIRLLMEVMNGVPEAPMETRPLSPRAQPTIAAGSFRAKVKAIGPMKEGENQRGPWRSQGVKLAWVEDGRDVESWANTFDERVLRQIAAFNKGDSAEVRVKKNQRGGYDLLDIADVHGGIAPEDVPF